MQPVRWALGCVNSRFIARESHELGFTQPRANLLADPCTFDIVLWISKTVILSNFMRKNPLTRHSQAELSDLLASNRREMLEAAARLERRTDEESRRLRTLEENVLDVEGDVEVNLNTTAYLENKMLVMERDGERDQFERQASCVYANTI